MIRLIAVCTVVASMWPGKLSAQQEPTRHDAPEFAQGLEAAKQQDWATAAQHFQRAAEVAPTANTLLNLAVVRYRLEQLLAAWAALERFDEAAAAAGERQRERATWLRAKLDERLATFVLSVEPADASVELDEAALTPSETGYEMKLLPGEHTIEVAASGHVQASRTFQAQAGATVQIGIQLAKQPAIDPPAVAESTQAPSGPAPAATPEVVRPVQPPAPTEPTRRQRRLRIWGSIGAAVLAAGAAALVAVSLRDPGQDAPYDDGWRVFAPD